MTRRVELFLSVVKQINTVFARFVYFLFSHRTISIRSQYHIIPLYQFPAMLFIKQFRRFRESNALHTERVIRFFSRNKNSFIARVEIEAKANSIA